MQHRVSKEENIQADMAAPQVTQVALYRLRNNEEGTLEEMPGCVREARANCNTDHSMVRAKLVVGQSVRFFRRASGRAGVKRWNVAKLQGDCEDDRGAVRAKGRFLESARKGLKEKWDTGKSVEENGMF